MKKLLLAVTLLGSLSAFADQCDMFIDGGKMAYLKNGVIISRFVNVQDAIQRISSLQRDGFCTDLYPLSCSLETNGNKAYLFIGGDQIQRYSNDSSAMYDIQTMKRIGICR